jgi:hypothetical protein
MLHAFNFDILLQPMRITAYPKLFDAWAYFYVAMNLEGFLEVGEDLWERVANETKISQAGVLCFNARMTPPHGFR